MEQSQHWTPAAGHRPGTRATSNKGVSWLRQAAQQQAQKRPGAAQPWQGWGHGSADPRYQPPSLGRQPVLPPQAQDGKVDETMQVAKDGVGAVPCPQQVDK